MDWQLLQAGVYGFLHWTPATFWELSLSEYYAAMSGVQSINEANSGVAEGNSGRLTQDDAAELRQLLKEKG